MPDIYPERPQAGDWMMEAACRGVDPDLFFPGHGQTGREAKEVCVSCPVRVECLDYAMDNHERYGVWGGLTEHERRTLRRTDRRPPLPTVVCGTDAGWRRHRNLGEDPCPLCDAAHGATLTNRYGGFPA